MNYCRTDASEANIISRSPLDIVWDKILTFPDDPFSLGLRRVFGKFLEADDNLWLRKFTTLHKIVLKLSPIPLAAQLQISTSDIDAQCSTGGTPLLWAVQGDDSDTVRILLNFGANIHVANFRGVTPIHAAARWSPECLKILLDAVATENSSLTLGDFSYPRSSALVQRTPYMESVVDCRTKAGFTPLHFACVYDITGVCATLLLDYSADIRDQCSIMKNGKFGIGSPLLTATQYNNHATIKLLLARGCHPNDKDPEKMGLLHLAAGAGDLLTLKILLSADVRVKGGMDEDIHGHTPLQAFEKYRPIYCVEDADTREQCREILLTILSRQDPDPANEEASTRTEDFDTTTMEEEPDVFYDFDEAIGTVN